MDDKKEKFLQDVIDLSVDGIIITDSSDPPVILYANPKIVELSEYDITEILGNTPSMFQGPRTNVETKKEIKTSMINREPYNGTILNYTKNGKPYMIDLSIKPITDNNGTDIFVAFLRNITDQIISSQEYEDNKALLESILDGCLSGIMTFRTLRDNNENICDFECILANEMATNLLNRDDLLGIKFSTLQSSFKDPELIDLMITSIEYESIIEKEVEYNHDVTIWLEISINKLDDGVVVTFNDITAKRMIEKSITENNKRMANILNNLPSFICLVNDQMEFSFINDHWREKLSIIPTNGQNYFDFMKRTFNITDDCVVQINMVLNGDRKNYSCEISANDDCYLLLWVAPIKINGNITGLTMMHVDITGQKQAEQALRESEKRFSLAVKGTNDGVWEWDIQNGTMWYSDVFASILGYDSTEDLPKYGKDLFKLIHPDDIRNLRNAINEHLDGNTDMLSSKHRLKNRHGDYRWVEVRAKAMQDDKKTICLIGTMTDVTDKLSMERKIYNIAHFDTLTGLPNRVLFYDRLSTAMKHSLRKNKSLALLYCDLDHFKHINDAFGHQIGDLYLKEIGSRLQQSLRAYDTVARLSGDEFAILMEIEHINGKNEALRIANRVIENINQPAFINEFELYSGVSIGISIFPHDTDDTEMLLQYADMAMYKAKKDGRNQITFFDEEMNLEAKSRSRIESRLRTSLSQDEFVMKYQPKWDFECEKICGAEALLHWMIDGKDISAANFIGVAEESGLIRDIGRWVFGRTCEEFLPMANRGLSLSVNISPNQFRIEKDISHFILDVLDETNFPPDKLIIEITENVVMSAGPQILDQMFMLSKHGVRVSIDDFGTGYSNLVYLKRYPIHEIKIDKSFVTDLTQNDMAICQAIIGLGKNLDIPVIAEGVETEEQMRFLKTAGCHGIQGYYIGRPILIDKFFNIVDDDQSLGDRSVQ